VPPKHKIHQQEIGQLRIFLTPHERHPARAHGWKRFLPSTALYMDIIHSARETPGIVSATAHAAHYGYSGHGKVQGSHAEDLNPHLPLCVELVGPKAALKRFCQAQGDLLRDKVMLYKHLEHWSFEPHGFKAKPATKKELMAGGA
jgi:PII-like signaling protein